MRKFFWITLLPALLLTGCRNAETIPVSNSISITKETAVETLPETEAETRSIAERAAQFTVSEHQHIYDECGVLTENENGLHTSYLEWIASSRLVNAFVVITEQLNGSTPEQFAEGYYQTVADAAVPDGFLVLINNDTNQDIIYTAGRCRSWMPQAEISVVLAAATRDLIEGRFSEALDRILPVSEKMPAYVLDNTASLTEAEMQEFSGKIRSVQEASGMQCAVVLCSFPEDSEPDVTFYQDRFQCDALLLLDPVKQQCRIIGEAALSETQILEVLETQGLPWAVRDFLENI